MRRIMVAAIGVLALGLAACSGGGGGGDKEKAWDACTVEAGEKAGLSSVAVDQSGLDTGVSTDDGWGFAGTVADRSFVCTYVNGTAEVILER